MSEYDCQRSIIRKMNKIISKYLNNQFLITYAPWITWKELYFGLQKEFIKDTHLIQFALETLTNHSSSQHFELACLQKDEFYKIENLLNQLMFSDNSHFEENETWLYLLLTLCFHYKNEINDPLSFVEELYANFDYPDSIENIVRYMPISGETGSEELLYYNWEKYLQTTSTKLLERF